MSDLDQMVALRCTARTHAKIERPASGLLRIRCTDGRCPDAVYASQTDQMCIHVWDLAHPDKVYRSEFEPQFRKALIRDTM